MKSLIAIALPVLALCPFAQTSLPKMNLRQQSRDGNPQFVDGPATVAGTGQFERVWFSQGRQRVQIGVSDRARESLEEDLGYEYESRMGALATSYQASNPAKDRLFTITLREVYETEAGEAVTNAKILIDDIQTPASPSTFLPTFEFAFNEEPLWMATSPDQEVLVVILNVYAPATGLFSHSELRTYDYKFDTLVLQGTASMPAGQTSCGADLLKLNDVQVARIDAGTGERYTAMVLATIDDNTCAGNKPQPTALLFCDIEDPATPSFYGNLSTQAWQPCRPVVMPPATPEPCVDFRVNGVLHYRTAEATPRDLVYAVGGKQAQLWSKLSRRKARGSLSLRMAVSSSCTWRPGWSPTTST